MVATLLENMADGETCAEEEKLARNPAGIAYAGGADTVNEFYSYSHCYASDLELSRQLVLFRPSLGYGLLPRGAEESSGRTCVRCRPRPPS
jgi:hypothetical protein